MTWAVLLVAAFFCGSLPFSVWLGRLLLHKDVRGYGDGNPGAGLELLIDRMRTFPSNDQFLAEIGKAPSIPG